MLHTLSQFFLYILYGHCLCHGGASASLSCNKELDNTYRYCTSWYGVVWCVVWYDEGNSMA